jgi:hypothetical protein
VATSVISCGAERFMTAGKARRDMPIFRRMQHAKRVVHPPQDLAPAERVLRVQVAPASKGLSLCRS